MSYFVVDVEADGPTPGSDMYSMVQIGIVKVADLSKTFYAELKPISERYIPEALAACNLTREETMKYDWPVIGMRAMEQFIKRENDDRAPVLISDNNGFDAAFVTHYAHKFLGYNPFGWSSRRIGDIYSGLVKQSNQSWKHKYRKTKHDHNPVNDAMGNAEALLAFRDELGFKVKY